MKGRDRGERRGTVGEVCVEGDLAAVLWPLPMCLGPFSVTWGHRCCVPAFLSPSFPGSPVLHSQLLDEVQCRCLYFMFFSHT